MKHEHLEFLPAALEIQESPPLPASRYILWAIMLFFSIGVVWASVGEVDIVGIAQGKIVPTGQVKVIQPLEAGKVKTIYVTEGQRVEAGDALIELDTTLAGAEMSQVTEQLLALKLDKARLLTILDTLDENQNTEYFENIDASLTQIQLHNQRAVNLLDNHNSNLQALKEELKQRKAEKASINHRIEQLNGTVPLITERVKAVEELLENNLIPRTQWLELEEERIEQVKEREVQQKNLSSINAAMNNINERIAALNTQFKSERLSELTDIENKITSLEQENIKATQRMNIQTLAAPVSGKVHQLIAHTIGGVVTPAQELMRIVPEEGAMEIEAWLPNKDIGFVEEGQEAEIKVETFPFTKYGTIDGEIKTLSNDATPDERLGLVYATRVSMDRTTMQIKDKTINLSPGMAVTVELNMGKRKLIEYLLTPLLRYRDESVRER